MLDTKVEVIDGVEYTVNESTDGKLIEGGFPHGYYTNAIDPVSENRTFVETDKFLPNEEFPAWQQGVLYSKGAKVTHNLYRYISTINKNKFEPRDVNLAWIKYVELEGETYYADEY